MIKFSIIKNINGFLEVKPKPSIKELKIHYSKKYYQNDHGQYKKSYTKEELEYFDNEANLTLNTLKIYKLLNKKKLLDLGCGEGFFASFFKKIKWDVTCVDLSRDGLARHNPLLQNDFIQSDILNFINSKKTNLNKFDLINLDNVLEHVLNPVKLIKDLRDKISSSSVIRIQVPNDFSKFQSLLLKRGFTKETWLNPPEHLNYFNTGSLKQLLVAQGFSIRSLQVDFPIEQFLVNNYSNYWKNKKLGKEANKARLIITNYLANHDIKSLIKYREIAADLDFGRVITVYVKKK